MKTTMGKVINAAAVITRLNVVRMKNTATARKLFSLKKLIQPEFEFYAEEEKKLIDELGGTVTEDGAILFADPEEGLRKLAEGRKELQATECDIPIDTPIIFRDNEGIQVSGEELEILEGLAEFKE